jgi:glycolate oxidase
MSGAWVRDLRTIVGAEHILTDPAEVQLYQYDGSIERGRPDCVVFPADKEQVIEIVRLAHRYRLPLTARGAGTGLSGGSLARYGGIQVVFSRMRRILHLDPENLLAVVEPGVVNWELSQAAARWGLHFAPDPSSQRACTIGGNVAENAGGPHTLAYGVTINHVLAIEVVTADGQLLRLGSATGDPAGYDLVALMVGSEGTLGLAVEITVRLTPLPETVRTLLAIFDSTDDATATVAALTAAGITPVACEMMDGWSIRMVEAWVQAGLPVDAAALLLIEVDGLREEAEEKAEKVEAVCRTHRAREVRLARDADERERLWKARKNAFGAVGRVAPNCYVQDGVIPRTKLPETLRRIAEIGRRYGFEIGNVFHAGDGNLHPMIVFDQRQPGALERARAAADEIIALCVAQGGSITGEHGVGMEKDHLMPLLFTEADLELMRRIHNAFDPDDLLNPGKIFPAGKLCGEIRAVTAGA